MPSTDKWSEDLASFSVVGSWLDTAAVVGVVVAIVPSAADPGSLDRSSAAVVVDVVAPAVVASAVLSL